jgi:hypothetical protein
LVMNLCTNAIHSMHTGGGLSVIVDAMDTSADRELSMVCCRPATASRRAGHGLRNGAWSRSVSSSLSSHKGSRQRDWVGTGIGAKHRHRAGRSNRRDEQTQYQQHLQLFLPRSDAPVMGEPQPNTPFRAGRRCFLVGDEKAACSSPRRCSPRWVTSRQVHTKQRGANRVPLRPTALRCCRHRLPPPGMTGMELARHLRESRSDIPIVLVGSYTGPCSPGRPVGRHRSNPYETAGLQTIGGRNGSVLSHPVVG